MVRDGVVRATNGSDVPIEADTVCVHGDGPGAAVITRRLHEALRAAGIGIRRFAA
jgi:UPF0271 protein